MFSNMKPYKILLSEPHEKNNVSSATERIFSDGKSTNLMTVVYQPIRQHNFAPSQTYAERS